MGVYAAVFSIHCTGVVTSRVSGAVQCAIISSSPIELYAMCSIHYTVVLTLRVSERLERTTNQTCARYHPERKNRDY